MTSLLRLTPVELEETLTALDAPRYRAEQVLQALYRRCLGSLDDITQLPGTLRDGMREAGLTLEAPAVLREVASDDGETTKALLALPGGSTVETVLMQYPRSGRAPRSTVCVSTQAGCAMGCVFCATGQMGFERNIPAEDIVAQVLHFQRLLAPRGEHVTNVVFMGMGEPLANYDETLRAVRQLTDPRAFDLAQRAITVSTVGIPRAIDRLAAEKLQVGLAISLHAPDDALRRRLVPTARPNSVAELLDAGRRYFRATGRRVSIEYALIDGVNDAPGQARALGKLLRGAGMHVNLIPLNATAGPFAAPSRRGVREFRRILNEAGVNATVRIEKGAEIAAACGQLRTDVDAASGTGSAASPARG